MPRKKINPFYATLAVVIIGTMFTTLLQNKILAFTDELGGIVNTVSGSTQTASSKVRAILFTPKAQSKVASPLSVSGKAPGNWYFEATLSIKILDADGTVLGQGPATAEGDWMTQKLVPFSATIPFDAPRSANGFIEIKADDPSGLGNTPSLRVPVTFLESAAGGSLCTSDVAHACSPSAKDSIGS